MASLKKNHWLGILLASATFFTTSLSGAASTDMLKALGGPAFTDPDRTITMPKKWQDKSIVYEPEAAGAQLSVTLDQHMASFFLKGTR